MLSFVARVVGRCLRFLGSGFQLRRQAGRRWHRRSYRCTRAGCGSAALLFTCLGKQRAITLIVIALAPEAADRPAIAGESEPLWRGQRALVVAAKAPEALLLQKLRTAKQRRRQLLAADLPGRDLARHEGLDYLLDGLVVRGVELQQPHDLALLSQQRSHLDYEQLFNLCNSAGVVLDGGDRVVEGLLAVAASIAEVGLVPPWLFPGLSIRECI